MNLDRTFCSGLRCGKTATCDRFTGNLEAEAERRGIDLSNRRISMAQFADHEGGCSMYSVKDEDEQQDQHL